MQSIARNICIVNSSIDETHRDERNLEQLSIVDASSVPSEDHSSDHTKKKSKSEKIKKLQVKNDLYKEEYKKVAKEKKNLKKEVEKRKEEVESLTKEIDSRIAETSVLKLKLSEALQELERSGSGDAKDKAMIQRLSDQLARSQLDLASAVSRVTKLNEEILNLKESLLRKDEQIESLTREVSNQAEHIRSLLEQKGRLTDDGEAVRKKDEKVVEELLEENARLQSELKVTLDRADALVKEREDAIAELLRENTDMKRLLVIHSDLSNDEGAIEVELNHLKDELYNTARALEETQDRNIMLEEEIEVLLNRVREMDPEIARLRDEVEEWQTRAKNAEESATVIEASVKAAEKKAEDARVALTEAQVQYSAEIAELEIKYKNALVAESDRQATERTEDCSVSSSSEGSTSEDQQANEATSLQDQLLQVAVANRQRKTGSGKRATWGSVISSFVKKEEEEELDEDQKQIKALEALRDQQSEEIKQLKSDMVRHRSSYNEALYVSKKQIELLTSENEAYAAKVAALQFELDQLRSNKDRLASYGDPLAESEHKSDDV